MHTHAKVNKLTDVTEVTEFSAQLLGRLEVRQTDVEMWARGFQIHARCCKSNTCIYTKIIAIKERVRHDDFKLFVKQDNT